MIILNRKPIVDDKVSVRILGADTTITLVEATKYAQDNRLFFKANKPATVTDVKNLL